jgi:hypothetical protein
MSELLNHQVVAVDEADMDSPISDEELEAMALAADPQAPLPDDAVPMGLYLSQFAPLPDWYMPPAMTRHGGKWRAPVILAVVSAFLIIDAFGLCSTYGPLVWA